MKEISSEAKVKGLVPSEGMTEEQFQEWRESLDPDIMGFDGAEGVENNEQ